MEKIVIDEALRARPVRILDSTAELCDVDGTVLARVLPIVDRSRYEPLEPQVSESELDRRELEVEEYTTAEVLAHLRSLDADKCLSSGGRLGPRRVGQHLDAS